MAYGKKSRRRGGSSRRRKGSKRRGKKLSSKYTMPRGGGRL